MRIGFIGLGHMGSGMASRLIEAGHELVVYNRTLAKAEPLVAQGAKLADTPARAAENVEVLVSMVSDDAAAEAVVLGERGVITALRRGAVHVSCSTISPPMSKRLAGAHAERGQRYIAAPVLGRPSVAAKGELVVVTAGASDVIERCEPVLHAIGSEIRIVGTEPEQANVAKLGVNLVLATILEVLGEAYALVEGHGMSSELFLDVLSSLLESPVVDKYGKRIAEERFEPAAFTMQLGAKDVRFAIDAAESHSVTMPLAKALRACFASAIEHGKANVDWSAVGRVSAPAPSRAR